MILLWLLQNDRHNRRVYSTNLARHRLRADQSQATTLANHRVKQVIQYHTDTTRPTETDIHLITIPFIAMA